MHRGRAILLLLLPFLCDASALDTALLRDIAHRPLDACVYLSGAGASAVLRPHVSGVDGGRGWQRLRGGGIEADGGLAGPFGSMVPRAVQVQRFKKQMALKKKKDLLVQQQQQQQQQIQETENQVAPLASTYNDGGNMPNGDANLMENMHSRILRELQVCPFVR